MKGLKILIVDDEPLMRLSMLDALEGVGCEGMSAATGTEGLAVLATRQFDIVITDLRLPGADGLTILKACKERSPTTEVILVGDVAQNQSQLRGNRASHVCGRSALAAVQGRLPTRSLERTASYARAETDSPSPPTRRRSIGHQLQGMPLDRIGFDRQHCSIPLPSAHRPG